MHAPGEADLNLYAYVTGAVLKNVDPLGLEETSTSKSTEQTSSSPNDVMIVPDVPLRADPTGINEEQRSFGEQWLQKDPENRRLVTMAPGGDSGDFESAVEEAAELSEGGRVILNIGHAAPNAFDMTPRVNDEDGKGMTFHSVMLQPQNNRTDQAQADARKATLERAGDALERNDVKEFVVMACRFASADRGRRDFAENVAKLLKTDVRGWYQFVESGVTTDENFVPRAYTNLVKTRQTSAKAPTGQPADHAAFTELPNESKSILIKAPTNASTASE